ncbi:fimbrial biogenesis chaperone [Orbus mooreae]|uniref:fimbrial biogenesis chaperone n=1 Tax=Orbus mooreae TaxID=3074107 RepID=UPI00370DCB46
MAKNILLLILIFTSNIVYANPGISLGQTRLIYKSNEKQGSVDINNSDNKAFLIQSWITKTPESKEKEDGIFIITPPLYRLEADSSNSIRIVYIGNSLPNDRESLFWLNVKAIPSTKKTDQNTLIIAIKSQIKLFYRPSNLSGDPVDAYKNTKFFIKNNKLIIDNPTPYYINFNSIKIDGVELNETITLAPFSNKQINKNVSVGQIATWNVINDYGAITPVTKVSIK